MRGLPQIQDLGILQTPSRAWLSPQPQSPSRKPLKVGSAHVCHLEHSLPSRHTPALEAVGWARCYLLSPRLMGSCSPDPTGPSPASPAWEPGAGRCRPPGATPGWAQRCGRLPGREEISWAQGSLGHPLPHCGKAKSGRAGREAVGRKATRMPIAARLARAQWRPHLRDQPWATARWVSPFNQSSLPWTNLTLGLAGQTGLEACSGVPAHHPCRNAEDPGDCTPASPPLLCPVDSTPLSPQTLSPGWAQDTVP